MSDFKRFSIYDKEEISLFQQLSGSEAIASLVTCIEPLRHDNNTKSFTEA